MADGPCMPGEVGLTRVGLAGASAAAHEQISIWLRYGG